VSLLLLTIVISVTRVYHQFDEISDFDACAQRAEGSGSSYLCDVIQTDGKYKYSQLSSKTDLTKL